MVTPFDPYQGAYPSTSQGVLREVNAAGETRFEQASENKPAQENDTHHIYEERRRVDVAGRAPDEREAPDACRQELAAGNRYGNWAPQDSFDGRRRPSFLPEPRRR